MSNELKMVGGTARSNETLGDTSFQFTRGVPDLRKTFNQHIRVAFDASADTELTVPIPSGAHQVRITNESAGEITVAIDETPGDTGMAADTTPTEAENQIGSVIRGGDGTEAIFALDSGTNIHMKHATSSGEALIEFM